MNVEISPRQSGKTTRLIRQAAECGGVIVCPSTQIADWTRRFARDLGYKIECVSFRQAEYQLRGRYDKPIFIDNADLILQMQIAGHTIQAVTFTGEGKEITRRKIATPKRIKASARQVEI